MQVSLSWLKDFVDIPRSITPEELGRLLTTHTVEIDSIEKQSEKYKNVVVGKILEINKHPNADKLQLTKVDVGKEKLDIVCGAPNIEVGQLVPVALVGTILPNGLEIKEAEVRGEKSSGMLCAADELGLGDDHSGILILDKNAKVGQDFSSYLGVKDTIYEVDNKSITHRPDLWGHYGIGNEIATFLDIKFKTQKINNKILTKSTNEVKLKGKVENFNLCPRYMAIRMDGIQIEDSPKWMQDRLIATGVRPINNIVDITNYVLLELGQPLHAFDAEFLGNNIVVRSAKNKEIIETLDGEKRELGREDILITDGKKGVAIGGIMGGANSEINNETKSIIIESANFNFLAIRKTSSKLGLRTESSVRFEKNLDPNLSEFALLRTVELVKKICPKAGVVSNLVDEKKFKLNQGPIELDLEWLALRIGHTIEKKKVIKILNSLGFIVKEGKEKLIVTVPTWRATRDISIKEDLVEEIARIYGYDNIKPKMPKVSMEAPEISEERLLIRKIKNILSGGPALTEVYNYSFVGEDQLKKLNIDYSSYVRLVNPISELHTMLRQSLTPNLINNIKTNQAKYDEIGLFEIGDIYLSTDGEYSKDNKSKEFLPFEEKRLGIIIADQGKSNVFKKVKGVLEYLMLELDLSVSYAFSQDAQQTEADIVINKKNLGKVTLMPKFTMKNIGVKKNVAVLEISLKELLGVISNKSENKYKKSEKYPSVVRDLAFVIDSKILYNDIKNKIINFNELIKSVELFDVYEGEKIGEGKKNLAFHIKYQAARTLIAEEVDKLQEELVKSLEKKFNAKIRNF